MPIEDIDSVVIHGSGQMTTQALHLCSSRGIPVQWYSMGGKFMAGTQSVSGRVRQRIRQFSALSDSKLCIELARTTILAKVESQLRYLMRATRGNEARREVTNVPLDRIRETLARLPAAASLDTIRGLEGMAAKSYFAAIPSLISDQATDVMIPKGRTKHPPKDRFNCLLSYGYSLLYGLVHRSLIAVGLEPAFGFFPSAAIRRAATRSGCDGAVSHGDLGYAADRQRQSSDVERQRFVLYLTGTGLVVRIWKKAGNPALRRSAVRDV